MKIRTKLVLLLSAALVATMGVSTILRIRYTRTSLENQLRETAKDTAEAIASELTKRLAPEMDQDEIVEELAKVKLRHPGADLELALDTDEDTVSTFTYGSNMDEAQVAKHLKAARLRPVAQRRDDARRALYDHGESTRRPGSRTVEPMWRTPDRPEPSRWPARVLPAPTQAPHVVARTFRESDRGRFPVFEVKAPVDPAGPRRGELTLWVTREPIERTVRAEKISSIAITGGAVVLLMFLSGFIVNRVVGKPVSELEAAMERASGGALDERVAAHRTDEVGRLQRGFNAMLTRIEHADADIRAFNRRLADEIEMATKDLARKNAALAQLNRLLLEARRQLGDKERLAALGQLAAQLAHEIGTPLGSVSGHLQLALSGRDVPAALKDRLQVATRELERVSKIVRDYLDSTRTVAPERVRVDVARIVDEAAGIVLGDERRAHVELVKEIDASSSELETDPGLLRQILVNLLTNAADAVMQAGSDKRGRVTVASSARDHLGGEPSGARRVGSREPGRESGLAVPSGTPAWIELAVRDDGVGIAAEDAARIFEPFYTTKGRGKGTGLGLAICRELATALGGRITVESAPGRGSTFTVSLPRGAAQKERSAS